MGKDKPAKAQAVPIKADGNGKASGKSQADQNPANAGRGHKQRGAGTVITARPAITTNDGIVLKPHERLPSQLLNEYCQREKRPMPKYVANPPGNRFTVNLEDSKNSKNDLSFSPNQAAESATVARDYAALLALFHFQRTLPLERKLPEPYSSTWLDMIRSAKGEVSPPPTNASQSTSKLNSTASNPSQTAAPAESKKAPATTVNLPAKLDRETADWLCDACGSQNFAKLLNGQPRVKCFRCQTPKSSTCSLVASATNAEVSEMKKKAAPKALTGLTTTSKFVSRSEAEQFQIQQRQERNRKMTFFDALKRVNRPKTIHFLVELRNKLEQLLGLQTEKSCNSSKFASSEHYHALLEEIEEEGLIAQDICEIPYSQQTSILQSVLSKLEIEEGDNSASLNNCVKVFLDKFLESFVEDFLFETSSSELSNEEIFEQLLESHLRNILAYNAKNLEISSSVPAEELSTNQIVGSYYGVLIQFLRMIGWNSNFLNSNAVQLTLQKLFPSDSIESDDTAIALAMITHAMFTFVANPNQSDGFLSSLSFLSQIKKQSQSTLAEEVEEEIAVLQSMFNDQFQMSTISVQGAGDQSQQFFLLSLEFSESYNFLKIPCKLKLRVLLTDHLGYPANLPFATLSIQEPAIIKNEKIFGMIFDLNVALFQKLSTLKGTSVLYELYSFIQGKLSEENGKRLIISSPRVDITKLEDFLTAVARGDIDDVPSLLAPVFTAKNSSAISPNINDNQSLITETESISVTPSESSKIPSTKVDKNIFGPSFWNRPKNPKPEPAVAVYPSRKSLPAWNSRDIFLQSLSDPSTRGMIVTGETGCGKTTQIPQFIAENSPSSKIVICQPRRLAAIGVATRVAEEQYSQLGDRVGYMVKGDSKVSPQTTIAFCTYGVLLRRLQDDPTLAAIDYIILDEIHERGIDSDFTLALLIDAILKRTNLKLILMSATISTGHFQQYLSRHLHRDNIPILEIPGFTYPVTEIFKGEYEEVIRNYPIKALQQSNNYDDGEDDEDYGRNKNNNMIPFRKKDIDYDLLCKLVFALIHPHETTSSVVQKATGCILIFLPGVPEINRFLQFFRTYYHRESSDDTIHLISLHGNVAPEEQLKIFHTHPRGHLKIIAATNVAEASVTIPDVTVVIDTCRVKEMDYNTDVQAYALTMKFAAKDSLRQRRGRAGRVQKGKCYRLITKGTFDKLPDHSVPEMLRLPLESILLQILSMKISLPNPNFAGAKTIIPPACDYILKKCPNTPKIENIVAALQILSSLQAIEYKPSVAEDDHSRASATTSETAKDFKILTPLGEIIARLPCHPRIGRLLIFGCLLDCVYPTLCVAATLTCRSPFTMGNDADSIEKVKQAKRKFAGSSKLKSDYNIIVNCFVAWERAKDSRRFCKNHGLIFERLIEIKQTMKDYLKDLLEIGVLSSRRYPSSYQDYLQYYEEQLQKIQDQPVQTTGASHLRYEYLLSAIYCAGLYPQVSKILHPPKRFMEVMGAAVERDAEAKEVKYYLPKNQLINPLEDSPALSLSGNTSRSVTADFDISTENLQRIFIHPSSANFSNASYTTSNYLLYGEKSIVNTVSPSPSGSNNSKGNNQEKIYIKDTSEVTAFALVLFGGSLSYDASKGLLLVDDWISFACSERIAAIFFRVREEFHRVLQRKLEVDRSEDFNLSDVPIIGVVKELLLTSFD